MLKSLAMLRAFSPPAANIIGSPHAGARLRTNRVSRWQDEKMAARWAGAAFLETEKNFRRIQG